MGEGFTGGVEKRLHLSSVKTQCLSSPSRGALSTGISRAAYGFGAADTKQHACCTSTVDSLRRRSEPGSQEGDDNVRNRHRNQDPQTAPLGTEHFCARPRAPIPNLGTPSDDWKPCSGARIRLSSKKMFQPLESSSLTVVFPEDDLVLREDPKSAAVGSLRRLGEVLAHVHYESAANGVFRCRAPRAAVSSVPDPKTCSRAVS